MYLGSALTLFHVLFELWSFFLLVPSLIIIYFFGQMFLAISTMMIVTLPVVVIAISLFLLGYVTMTMIIPSMAGILYTITMAMFRDF